MHISVDNHIKPFELITDSPSLRKLPKLSFIRWLAIPFVGVLQFTNYICYYNPQPLQTTFYRAPFMLSSTQYNFLFSVYSFPNIIMTPLGGWLLDKKGLYYSMFAFVACLLFGQTIVLIFGGGLKWYIPWLVGRFFSGIGSENLSMAQKVILANWFIGNERIFAYGTNTSFAQLAIIITSSFMPMIFEAGGNDYLYPFLFSFLVAVFALISCFIIVFLDKRVIMPDMARFLAESGGNKERKIVNLNENSQMHSAKHDNHIEHSQMHSISEVVIKEEMNDKRIEKALILEKQDERSDSEPKGIRLKDLKALGIVFWLLVWSNYLSYGSFFTFIDNSNDLLVSNYQYEYKEAGHLLTVIFIISSVASPVFGFALKNIGKKMAMMLVSLTLFLIALMNLLLFEVASPGEKNMLIKQAVLIPLTLIGLFYAMNFSLIWTCISMVVDKNRMGSAFGVVYSSRNLNLVLSPLIAGIIHDSSKDSYGGYLGLEVFLLGQIVLAVGLNSVAWVIDYRGKRILV